jgi:hypothetical protein
MDFEQQILTAKLEEVPLRLVFKRIKKEGSSENAVGAHNMLWHGKLCQL